MLWRREGTEKIEEKESILSGMVAAGFVTFCYRQRKPSFLMFRFEWELLRMLTKKALVCTLEIQLN